MVIEWGMIVTGVAIGLAVAAPVGPINLMCIQRTLQHGFLSGLASGAGAVLGDGVFAAISAFGLTWIAELVSHLGGWLQGVGGVALVAMGLRTMLMPNGSQAAPDERKWIHHGGLIGTTFLLTITNPATLFGFFAIFSGVGDLVATPGNYGRAAQLVVAVMAGSLLWWIILARLVSYFRERVTSGGLTVINRVSGLVILAFGAVVLVDLVTDGLIS